MSSLQLYRNQRLTMYMEEDITIGDIVQLSRSISTKNVRGIVRFIGEVNCLRYKFDKFYSFNYFGIELFQPEGDNNGTINDEYYFQCKDKHGIFIKRDKIKKIVTINYSVPRLTIDDVIYMEKFKCNGRIRFIGKLDEDINPIDGKGKDVDLINYGIELNRDYGDNDGCYKKHQYFAQCRPDYGIFVTNRDLSDLRVMKKSDVLFYGFMGHDYDYIPQVILWQIKQFFNFIHIGYHKSITIMAKDSSGTDKRVSYWIYDVYNMDNYIHGPMIYQPRDSNHTYDKSSGIKIDTSADDYDKIFDEMARKYGATSDELKQELKDNGITDLNGLRFVAR